MGLYLPGTGLAGGWFHLGWGWSSWGGCWRGRGWAEARMRFAKAAPLETIGRGGKKKEEKKNIE